MAYSICFRLSNSLGWHSYIHNYHSLPGRARLLYRRQCFQRGKWKIWPLAKPKRVNGLTWNFAHIITSWGWQHVPKMVKFRWGEGTLREGWHWRPKSFLFFSGFVSSTRPQVAPIDVSWRTIAQNACFDVRKCLWGVSLINFQIWGCGGQKIPKCLPEIGKSHCKKHIKITRKRLKIDEKLQLTTKRKPGSLF